MVTIENRVVKIVGLCQVNDIVQSICESNNLEQYPGSEKLVEIYESDSGAFSVPSVAVMQELVQKKGPRKKGYEVEDLNTYLLISSLHNRGAGCGGTSPLVVPFAVYLVDEKGIESGGLYHNITTAYDKCRELVGDYFDKDETRNSLFLITPNLNRKILNKQLSRCKTVYGIEIEEMDGDYSEHGDVHCQQPCTP